MYQKNSDRYYIKKNGVVIQGERTFFLAVRGVAILQYHDLRRYHPDAKLEDYTIEVL
jgi:hypothetical protein